MPVASDSRCSPIGVFDSGIGGLTVMQEIIKHLPQEQVLYFGDTARLPYGEKSSEAIVRYSIENTIFLMDQKIKLLVVACNTASAHSMIKLRQLFNVPMVDIVEAGVNQVVLATKNQKIAVLGTRGTISSNVHKDAILKLLPDASVITIACPLLAPLVEENFANHPVARLIVREYLAKLKDSGIDTLLLGCSHFPLLASVIQDELPGVTLVDPAISCALQIGALLKQEELEAMGSLEDRNHRFYVSDDPHKFSKLATNFLGGLQLHVEEVSLWSN
jgi:glutamate racemase